MPTRERSYRVEAVVLSHRDYGEADRMIGLYTRELGKITVLAKGARKARSRKAGHLEPFTRVSLQLAHGQSLHIITQAETIDAYLPLREDLLAFGHAAYAVELVERIAYEGEENQALFRLLTATLKRLSEAHDPRLVLRFYDIRLLDLSGFRPKLFLCANCQRQIQPEDQYFSAEMGGVLCPDCGRGRSGARPISITALKYLRHLQRSNFTDACKASPSKAEYDEMENVLQSYFTYILERRLNTPAFLRRIKAGIKEETEDGDEPMA
jgi:DNA repair protein RecO (recombination protein O)